MKRIYNYILISALAFIAVGCINEGLEPDMPVTGGGNDVKFGLSFDESKTRTIYGPEDTTFTEDKKIDKISFPIYWADGDKVLVASPQCAVTSAEYQVTPVSGQSYAEALNKTGGAGVQWGSTNADFYSVYPSKNASWSTLTKGNVTAKLNIASEQSTNIVLSNGVYTAADMDNVIMYAQTNNVPNGETVDLKYKPYSTMLEFELNIGNIVDEQGNPTDEYGSAKIMSLTLTAPEGTNITGDFSLKFNGNVAPTIQAVGNNSNSNSISMHFTTTPLLNETNRTLKIKLAMIPLSGVKINGWTFTVEYIDGNSTVATTKTKKLTIDQELMPGMIHKIKMPLFPTQKIAWNPNLGEWISTLYDYKNIYITELSLPGAWYAGGKIYTTNIWGQDESYQNYQETNDFETLWSDGVRAFAVECRTSSTRSGSIFNSTYTPSSVVVSGTQSNNGDACTGGTQIRTIIKAIADQVASSKEFGVLVLSYADGGTSGHRDADHAYFINGVNTEIANSGATNIYTEKVDANTTVADVVGKLIIKINVDDRIPKGSYDGKMNALLSYNPFIQNINPLFSKMYWMGWDDGNKNYSTSFNEDDFWWCFSSANRTQVNPAEDATADATIPTYAQRQAALRGMIEHSKELTATKKHNVWFYFNAGGVETTSISDDNTNAKNFAATMNAWLYDLVKLKANGGTDTKGVYGTVDAYIESDPSPLGIVMFNQCTNDTYHGPDIIEEIVHMNNKFELLRATTTIDPDTPTEPVPGEGEEV